MDLAGDPSITQAAIVGGIAVVVVVVVALVVVVINCFLSKTFDAWLNTNKTVDVHPFLLFLVSCSAWCKFP